jgi:fatty-acyl-CoA synthase
MSAVTVSAVTGSAATVADLLIARIGDHHAGYICDDAVFSWDDVVRESLARAKRLTELLDRNKPMHVGVLLENTPEYLFWAGGAAFVGAAVVGINPTRRGDELARDIRHTECQVIVTDERQREVLDGLDTGAKHLVVVDDAVVDDPADLAGGPLSAPLDLPAKLPDPATTLFLLFTSGSTGAPKAVVCSTGRMAGAGQRAGQLYGVTRDEVCYSSMPLFHGNALMACWAPALAVGATLVLRRRFSASQFASDIRRHGCTYFTYVGRSLAYVLAQPEASTDSDNRLRLGFGTEATPLDRERFAARFGCPLVESYGSSESVVIIGRTPDTPEGALGRAHADDIAVVDPETGIECPAAVFDTAGGLSNPEAIGEIVNRSGGGSFEGYYNNHEATLDRLRGGWYWTGDLAFRDTNGFFWFAGRNADWLRVDSENFAATPVERILERAPGVAIAAVFPVPDVRTGDAVMAALEMASGAVFDPATFGMFLDAQPDLGSKWAPRFVRIVDAMPVTPNNKVAKAELRRDAWRVGNVWWRPTGSKAYRQCGDDDRRTIDNELDVNGRSGLLV